jgi:hypothetical protein
VAAPKRDKQPEERADRSTRKGMPTLDGKAPALASMKMSPKRAPMSRFI